MRQRDSPLIGLSLLSLSRRIPRVKEEEKQTIGWSDDRAAEDASPSWLARGQAALAVLPSVSRARPGGISCWSGRTAAGRPWRRAGRAAAPLRQNQNGMRTWGLRPVRSQGGGADVM